MLSEKLLRIVRNTFISGSLYFFSANIVVGLMNYVFNSLAARQLGPEQFGDISSLLSYHTLATIPFTIIMTVFIKKIGSLRDNELVYAQQAEAWVIAKARQYAWIIVFFILAVPLAPMVTNITPVAAYGLVILVLITYWTSLYDGILQGLHLFVWFSVVNILSVAVKLLGVLVVADKSMRLLTIVIFILLSFIVRAFLSRYFFHRKIPVFEIAIGKPIVKSTISLLSDYQVRLTIISFLSITLIENIAMVVVKHTLSSYDAGLFGAWLLLSRIVLFVFGPLTSIAYVFFAHKKQRKNHARVFLATLVIVGVVGALYVMLYRFYGHTILKLIFGQLFDPILPFLWMGGLFGVGLLSLMIVNNYFLAQGSRAVYLFFGALIAYCIVLLAFTTNVFIAMYITTVSTYIILVLYFCVFVVQELTLKPSRISPHNLS